MHPSVVNFIEPLFIFKISQPLGGDLQHRQIGIAGRSFDLIRNPREQRTAPDGVRHNQCT